MSRKPLVVGNWKMNGSQAQVDAFSAALDENIDDLRCDLGICVPFVYVERMANALSDSAVYPGAQDVAHVAEAGALTGAVNADMLADVGAAFVIVGHSERRAQFGETDDIVVQKIESALGGGLRPIVCVGETLDDRDADRVEQVLGRQVGAVVDHFDEQQLGQIVLAYEPVWAIGTGHTATPAQVQSTHSYIRAVFETKSPDVAAGLPMLYGGSVKPDNAEDLFAGSDVDGALVGGASLDCESFVGIARAA